jgi:FKBP-type peptidyl-prolyl cis-trans isomerase
MRNNSIKLQYFFILILICFGCECNNRQNKSVSVLKPGKDEMAELNRYLVQKDREIIENYAERKNLNMAESRAGLWYMIINEGSGDYFADNDRVVMEYDCSLLDGTLCYSSESLGPKEIILGKTEIEQGLNEGLRMLKPGGQAIFIIPPFLAYGLIGDGEKIPSRSVIVYSVKIMKNIEME